MAKRHDSADQPAQIQAHVRMVLCKLTAPSRASERQRDAGSVQKGVQAEGEEHSS